jgi:hypothetical protein
MLITTAPERMTIASASNAPFGTCSTACDLSRVPALDLRTKPKAGTTGTEVEHWSRHVGPAMLVLADRVAVGEAENSGDIVCVDELVNGNSSGHEASLHR